MSPRPSGRAVAARLRGGHHVALRFHGPAAQQHLPVLGARAGEERRRVR